MKIELSDEEVEYLIRAIVFSYGQRQEDYQTDIGDTGRGGLLIGKFVSATRSAYKAYRQAKDDRFTGKDPIKRKLFMGAGWHSIIAVNALHKRLKYATSELGGLEQNGGMGTEFDEQADKEGRAAIKEVMKDILFAFDLSPDDLKE